MRNPTLRGTPGAEAGRAGARRSPRGSEDPHDPREGRKEPSQGTSRSSGGEESPDRPGRGSRRRRGDPRGGSRADRPARLRPSGRTLGTSGLSRQRERGQAYGIGTLHPRQYSQKQRTLQGKKRNRLSAFRERGRTPPNFPAPRQWNRAEPLSPGL